MTDRPAFRDWQLAHAKKHRDWERNARLRVRWFTIAIGSTTRSLRKFGDAMNQALIKLNESLTKAT